MPLSEVQMKYLALAWACFDAEPKIDYEKFHQLAGLKSAHCARETMRTTKKKLREEYGLDAEGAASPAKAAASPKQKKNKTLTAGVEKKEKSQKAGAGKKRKAGEMHEEPIVKTEEDLQNDLDDIFEV